MWASKNFEMLDKYLLTGAEFIDILKEKSFFNIQTDKCFKIKRKKNACNSNYYIMKSCILQLKRGQNKTTTATKNCLILTWTKTLNNVFYKK